MQDLNLVIVIELIGAGRCLMNTASSQEALSLIGGLLYFFSLYWVEKDRVLPLPPIQGMLPCAQ